MRAESSFIAGLLLLVALGGWIYTHGQLREERELVAAYRQSLVQVMLEADVLRRELLTAKVAASAGSQSDDGQ